MRRVILACVMLALIGDAAHAQSRKRSFAGSLVRSAMRAGGRAIGRDEEKPASTVVASAATPVNAAQPEAPQPGTPQGVAPQGAAPQAPKPAPGNRPPTGTVMVEGPGQVRARPQIPVDGAPAPAAEAPLPKTAVDSAAGTAATPTTLPPGSVERETFSYARSGRRDPFVSLMASNELRPLITDLQLVAIIYDGVRRQSVAVMRDVSTKEKEQYRARVGQSVGRMRVSQITPKSVVFTIEEFGYSRQETLQLGESKQERKQ